MARKRDSKLTAARQIIKRHGAKRGPSVGAVDPEFRTDGGLPASGGTGDKDLREETKEGNALGAYVVEWGYDVPESNWSAFHTWLAENEVRLARTVPPGVHYKGTVVAVFGPLNRPDGRYRTFWALDSTSCIESFWLEGKSEFKTLVAALVAFRQRGDCCENGFSQLYQVAAGAPTYTSGRGRRS